MNLELLDGQVDDESPAGDGFLATWFAVFSGRPVKMAEINTDYAAKDHLLRQELRT